MNAYQQGVSHAIGMTEANVGTPNHLFYPPDLKNGYGSAWFRRKLSTRDVADLMHVDPTTVHSWRKKGWLEGNKTGTRVNGWRKIVFWRHSLKDVEACLLSMKTRKQRGNSVEHTTWTPQEIELLKHNEIPELRSRQACRNMKHRLRQKGEL